MPSFDSKRSPSPIHDTSTLAPVAPASTSTGSAAERRRSSSLKYPAAERAPGSYPAPPRKPLTPTRYVPAFASDDEMFKERYIALQLLINDLEDENNLISYRIAKEETRMRHLGLPLPSYAFTGPPNPPPENDDQTAVAGEPPYSAAAAGQGGERAGSAQRIDQKDRETTMIVRDIRDTPVLATSESASRAHPYERGYTENLETRHHDSPLDHPNGTKRRRESGDIPNPRSISPSTHSYPPPPPSNSAARSARTLSPRASFANSDSRRTSTVGLGIGMDIDETV
ncbi:hypothetical protein IAR50_001756 [Cryptococcus sp. DSM 104548]